MILNGDAFCCRFADRKLDVVLTRLVVKILVFLKSFPTNDWMVCRSSGLWCSSYSSSASMIMYIWMANVFSRAWRVKSNDGTLGCWPDARCSAHRDCTNVGSVSAPTHICLIKDRSMLLTLVLGASLKSKK